MRQRPESFRIDCTSPLARGLVFAGLGQSPGSVRYKDSSSRRNDGALTNMDPPTDWVWVPELGRWGLDFDGSNDYVGNVAVSPPGTNDFTISFWSVPVGSWINQYPCACGWGTYGAAQCHVRVQSRDSWQPYCGTVGIVGPTAKLDIAEHVAITRNGNVGSLYIDGAYAAGSNSWGEDVTYTTQTYQIGQSGLVAGRYWNGGLCDNLVHSRALSPPEIATLADPSNVMLSGLILPPKRKLYAIRSTVYSQRYFSLQTSIGAFALQS